MSDVRTRMHLMLMVFFECDRELMSGDFVSVKITGSTEYDLMGIMEENV